MSCPINWIITNLFLCSVNHLDAEPFICQSGEENKHSITLPLFLCGLLATLYMSATEKSVSLLEDMSHIYLLANLRGGGGKGGGRGRENCPFPSRLH